MVEIQIVYEGKLRCSATHIDSGAKLLTDAPKDNMGKGESFSPTDLVATALGTCMLTTMGIVAQRMEIDLKGARVVITKDDTTIVDGAGDPTAIAGRIATIKSQIAESESDDDPCSSKTSSRAAATARERRHGLPGEKEPSPGCSGAGCVQLGLICRGRFASIASFRTCTAR